MDRETLTRRARAAFVLGEALARVAALWLVVRGVAFGAWFVWLALQGSTGGVGFLVAQLAVHLGGAAVLWLWAPGALEGALARCRPAEVRARAAPWVAVGLAALAGWQLHGGLLGLTVVLIDGRGGGLTSWAAVTQRADVLLPAARAALGTAILSWLPALTGLWARANRRRAKLLGAGGA